MIRKRSYTQFSLKMAEVERKGEKMLGMIDLQLHPKKKKK